VADQLDFPFGCRRGTAAGRWRTHGFPVLLYSEKSTPQRSDYVIRSLRLFLGIFRPNSAKTALRARQAKEVFLSCQA
jgi:hypothetical protein